MKNFELKEKFTIVEIGPEGLPIYQLFKNNETIKRIGKDVSYIAIDCAEDGLKGDNTLKKGEAVVSDLKNLPLKNNSADQIYLMNVFGNFEKIPEKQPDGSFVYKMSHSDIFSDLSRVCKEKGSIFIGEIIPPAKPVEWLKTVDFSKFGLTRKIYQDSKEIKPFLEKMGCSKIILDSIDNEDFSGSNNDFKPFFIVLEKE